MQPGSIVNGVPHRTSPPKKPSVAIVKFASCDGCQLTLLDCEDELLSIADRIHFAHFAEASSDLQPGPYDLAIVEGSISTEEDKHRIAKLRSQSKKLITIGACATAGGVQALRNFADHEEFKRAVYASPSMIESSPTPLRSQPMSKSTLNSAVAPSINGNSSKSSSHSPKPACRKPPPNAPANLANAAARSEIGRAHV